MCCVWFWQRRLADSHVQQTDETAVPVPTDCRPAVLNNIIIFLSLLSSHSSHSVYMWWVGGWAQQQARARLLRFFFFFLFWADSKRFSIRHNSSSVRPLIWIRDTSRTRAAPNFNFFFFRWPFPILLLRQQPNDLRSQLLMCVKIGKIRPVVWATGRDGLTT